MKNRKAYALNRLLPSSAKSRLAMLGILSATFMGCQHQHQSTLPDVPMTSEHQPDPPDGAEKSFYQFPRVAPGDLPDTVKDNPLVKPSTLPHGAPMWDQIKVEHLMPALDWALEQARKNLEIILSNPEEPDFKNTIEALEFSSDDLDRVQYIFHHLRLVKKDEAFRAIEGAFNNKLVQYSNDVLFNKDLFERINKVYNSNQSSLDVEEKRLLNKVHSIYVRNGASLSEEKQQRLREINVELEKQSTKFDNNKLAAPFVFKFYVSNEADLEGLSKEAMQSAAEKATEKGQAGKWLFDNDNYYDVINHAKDQNLVRRIWRARKNIYITAPFDNRPVMKKMLELRHEQAQILGYETYADYAFADRMEKNVDVVREMNQRLLDVVKLIAEKEVQGVRRFARQTEGVKDLKPWSFWHYHDELQEKKNNFSSSDLKPYLSFDNVAQGVFDIAHQFYGVTFKESKDYPVYHEDVKVYEMFDETGDVKGVLYIDFFERPGEKKAGAWMWSNRRQGVTFGQHNIPVVYFCGNASSPEEGQPPLLSLRWVKTFAHELGHALQGLLSGTKEEINYRALAGTNVKWDAVEYPSQFNEYWVKEPDFLRKVGKHWKTGEPIPESLIEKMENAGDFGAAISMMYQLQLTHLDMEFYTTPPSEIDDVVEFELQRTRDYHLIDPEGEVIGPRLSHIFPGSYPAGYSVYLRAKLLAADTYQAFKKDGGLESKDVSKRFQVLLSSGGKIPMDVLYRYVVGRDPAPDALLQEEGFLLPENSILRERREHRQRIKDLARPGQSIFTPPFINFKIKKDFL